MGAGPGRPHPECLSSVELGTGMQAQQGDPSVPRGSPGAHLQHTGHSAPRPSGSPSALTPLSSVHVLEGLTAAEMFTIKFTIKENKRIKDG